MKWNTSQLSCMKTKRSVTWLNVTFTITPDKVTPFTPPQKVSWPCSWSAARPRSSLSADDWSRRRKKWRLRDRRDSSSIPRWGRTLWRAGQRVWEIKYLKRMALCIYVCVCVCVGGDAAGPAGTVQEEWDWTEASLPPRDLWPSGCPSPHWQLAESHARAGPQTEKVCVHLVLFQCHVNEDNRRRLIVRWWDNKSTESKNSLKSLHTDMKCVYIILTVKISASQNLTVGFSWLSFCLLLWFHCHCSHRRVFSYSE